MKFDSDQDWGPFKTLFGAFENCRVQITMRDVDMEDAVCDAMVGAAKRDHVSVQWFREGDDVDPTGEAECVPYDCIVELVVY